MDTSFPAVHRRAPPTLRHQRPCSSIVDEFNLCYDDNVLNISFNFALTQIPIPDEFLGLPQTVERKH